MHLQVNEEYNSLPDIVKIEALTAAVSAARRWPANRKCANHWFMYKNDVSLTEAKEHPDYCMDGG